MQITGRKLFFVSGFTLLVIFLLVLIGISRPQVSQDLPVVGSFNNLKRLIKKAPHTHYQEFCRRCHPIHYATAHSEHGTTTNRGSGGDSYLAIQTVRQGQHLFILKTGHGRRRSRFIVARVLPVGKMKVESVIKIRDPRFEPRRWIVRNERLIILGDRSYRPRRTGHHVLRTIVYDISKPRTPKKIREIEIEGSLLSVRQINSTLWFWLEKNIDFDSFDAEPSDDTFVYKDSATSRKLQHFGYNRINYFEEMPQHSFLIIGALDLSSDRSPFNISAFLGGADAISMTKNNAYVMTTKFVPYKLTKGEKELKPKIRNKKNLRPVIERTLIYRFSILDGRPRFKVSREIDGSVVAAYQSTDGSERLGIETATNRHWLNKGEGYNSVYVMSRGLKRKQKKIDVDQERSLRGFFDEETVFSSTDTTPTFPDLKNLKQLEKKDGFDWEWLAESGFKKWRKKKLIRIQTGATKIGPFSPDVIRLSILDISSGQPREMHSQIVGEGDWGPDYDMSLGGMAGGLVFFDNKRSLLALPVTVSSVVGPPRFEGAYVYTVDSKIGFRQRGIINYFGDVDLEDQMNRRPVVVEDLAIKEMFVSGNHLFTISEAEVKVLNIKSLKEVKRLPLPKY